MKFSLRQWGAGQLLLTWAAYWVALGVATLTPAIALIARISGTGAHGNASVGFDDGLLKVTITSTGVPSWTGAIQFSSLIFLVFGPPLLLWIAWAVSRPRRDVGVSDAPAPALRDAPYDATAIERPSAADERARRDRAP